jgi:hypothetical protein
MPSFKDLITNSNLDTTPSKHKTLRNLIIPAPARDRRVIACVCPK